MYLIFDTYEEAFVVNAVISQNMRFDGNVTASWADIQETRENEFALPLEEEQTELTYIDAEKFALLKPHEQYMEHVSEYIEANKVEGFDEEI